MAGRPRQFDRTQALHKARDLFWQRGFEATSMADLVTELGIASARIYAAFGSKEALFREAIESYETGEGAFAALALEQEPLLRDGLQRMFRDAIALYTRPEQPYGCMVVSAATNCSQGNDGIRQWLAEHRQQRTESIIQRFRHAIEAGELKEDTDAAALGDYYATLLHGLSVQARDGVSPERLLAMIPTLMTAFDLAQTETIV
ncbi:helix-turn-helix domain-containing protein [Pseudomonas purpurea]|uniref:TetR/AcrR family transcriptional regulator n=1 Tax=Pseudomonas purpurea TaxID=3136737 RepID=UPI00326456E0